MTEGIKFWHDRLLGLDLVRVRLGGCYYKPHSHETFVMMVLQQGAFRLVTGGVSHDLAAGSILIFHPDQSHGGDIPGRFGLEYRTFYPDAQVIAKLHAELGGSASQAPNFGLTLTDPDLANRLIAAHVMIEQGEVIEREAALLWALGTLICRASRLPPLASRAAPRSAVAQAREYIHACYAMPLTIRELAQVADCTEFQLIRAFQRDLGLSVHTYLTQVRLNHARRHLLRGETSAEVAVEVGFTDQSHMIRRFRQAYGVTPGAYVRNSRH